MQSVLLCSLILLSAVVFGQDPAQICLPSQLQVGYYNFIDNRYGVYSLDFTKSLAAKYDAIGKYVVVFDLKTFIAYNVTASGKCTKYRMDSTDASFQCLPSSAKLVSNNNTYLGHGLDMLIVQTWEIGLGEDTTLRLAYTMETPAFPTIRHLRSRSTGSAAAVFVYYNAVTEIDPKYFVIPSTCPNEIPLS
ncbi:unnamed protein product [Lymnaea stagnalis]|uniref:Uncharacterized protein n=1 Tax=Lymnaea stagnalis TaxID=6523 RepID=A0AAV2IAM1_LYMST